MKTPEQSFDLYAHTGPRAPFLLSTPWYIGNGYLIYILDFWREYMDEDVETMVDWSDSWERARALWHDIERCCHQAERMMALQPTWERATDTYNEHLRNMTPLVEQLRAEMMASGISFPEATMETFRISA